MICKGKIYEKEHNFTSNGYFFRTHVFKYNIFKYCPALIIYKGKLPL